jgi:hypothetical protein
LKKFSKRDAYIYIISRKFKLNNRTKKIYITFYNIKNDIYMTFFVKIFFFKKKRTNKLSVRRIISLEKKMITLDYLLKKAIKVTVTKFLGHI